MRGLLCVVVAALCACSEGTPKRSAESVADTATAAPPPPPEASDVPPLRSNIESPNVGAGPEYVAHGVCPYQCCTYGSSTMISPGTLRASPTFYSDSLARVVAGSRIHTDSGIVIMSPTGLAVVVEETSEMRQSPSGFRVGDTLEILNSVREGVHRMRLHGEEFEATTTELGRTAGWLRIIREPVQYWWIYMTDSTSGKSGWMRMGGVATGVNEPLHADACR
jgi:hypothetical protein